ncbi:MAG: PAS domain-containing protein [Bacteroidetes bacterium]|nr:PAS domain-containing protein [Bacteroidota bacterium]
MENNQTALLTKLTPYMIVTNEKITGCNNSLVNLYEYPGTSSLLEKSIWSLLPDKQGNGNTTQTKINSFLKEAANGKSIKFTCWQKTYNKGLINVSMELIPIGQYKSTSILILVEELSKKPNLVKLYKKQEREYNLLLKHIKAVVYKADINTHQIKFISDNAVSLFGYPPTDWTTNPDSWINIIHPDDKEKISSKIHELINIRKPTKLVYRCYDKENNLKWIEHHLHWELDHNNQYILGLYYDITLNKIMEKGILEKEKGYKQFIEQSKLGIFKINVAGKLELANKTFLNLFEFNETKDCSELNMLQIIFAEETSEVLWKLQESPELLTYEINNSLNLSFNLHGILDNNGALIAIEGFVQKTDI